MWQAGEAFREEVAAMDDNLPKIGKTRVGLHWGEAVVQATDEAATRPSA